MMNAIKVENKIHPIMLALTGAGISKASGIPTFEDVPGLKQKLSVEYKNTHKAEFKEAMQTLKDVVKDKRPNAAHKTLAKHRIPIITMNVDGLHQKAGSDIVIECHGNAAADTVVLYGQRAHYDGAFELLHLYAQDSCKKVLLVIGTSLQTEFANEFVEEAMELNYKIVTINEDAEHRVEQEIQKAYKELTIKVND